MNARRIAWTLVGTSLLAMVIGQVATWSLGLDIRVGETFVMDLAYATIGAMGALVASRHPKNPVGWMLIGITFLVATSLIATDPLAYLVAERGLRFPGIGLVATLGPLGWGMSGGLIVLTLHLFPDGKPLSRRWAWVFRLGVFGLSCAALAVVTSLQMDLGTGEEIWVANPLGELVGGTIHRTFELAASAIIPAVLLTPAVVVLRYRRSTGDVRAQMKWLVYAVAMVAVGLPAASAMIDALGHDANNLLFAIGLSLLPASVGTAILKYRLYDIDVVISRTVVFAGLAGFITAIYVGIVVGAGTLLGAGDEPNLALSIVATAVVAVAFQPVRERLTRLANRLVFGKRATPYEVLSRFSSHLGETVATEETLQRMARLLADGTGAAHAQVSLWLGDAMVPAASVGQVADASAEAHTVDVSHQGEVLGALSITKKRGEQLTPADVKLVDDLAGQAGLLLRNVRLTEELKQKIVDLRASRQRLVAAQDQERRRLERDLHDGAQQQIVAMKLKLGIARTLAQKEGAERTVEVVDQLTVETDECVQTLRELAHGIYPPLLAADGLEAALTTAARRAAVPVTVTTDGIGRYPPDVEAAVYFCVLEAVNNAAKYAHPTQVTVRLTETGGQLAFEVSDDGVGFDPATTERGHGLTNMTDRLDALSGHLDLRSGLGSGTAIRGTVPVTDHGIISALH